MGQRRSDTQDVVPQVMEERSPLGRRLRMVRGVDLVVAVKGKRHTETALGIKPFLYSIHSFDQTSIPIYVSARNIKAVNGNFDELAKEIDAYLQAVKDDRWRQSS